VDNRDTRSHLKLVPDITTNTPPENRPKRLVAPTPEAAITLFEYLTGKKMPAEQEARVRACLREERERLHASLSE
jgi:hypothetical protein